MTMSKRPLSKDSLKPLDYLLISKFDAEITRSDFLMNLPTLVKVNMVLRVLSEDRKIHR